MVAGGSVASISAFRHSNATYATPRIRTITAR
jgi:hypothetical protein